MKAFKIDNKQQEKIAAFFKEETTYFPNHVMLKAAGIFLVVVSYMLLIIPVSEWGEDGRSVIMISFLLFAMGIFLYASKYASFTEPLTKKVVSIASLTKYLPVNRMQLLIFRIRKVLKPCVISAVVVIAFRCLLSYALHGSLSVWDVVLPVVFMVIWPVVTELTR